MPAAIAYVVWAMLAMLAAVAVLCRRWDIRRRRILLALVAAASVVAFGVVSWGRATPFGDFNKAYYPAGVAVVSDPSRLYECQISNACFVNIPIVAALFAPFGWLDLFTAQVLFTMAGAGAVIVAAYLLTALADGSPQGRYAVIAMFALNGPLLYSARLGNLTHVMLPFLVLAVVALVRGRQLQGGALLAFLATIKPPLLLFVPYLLARGQWRAAVGFSAALAMIAAMSLTWFGAELHSVWLEEIGQPFSDRPLGAYNVQSVAGALAHLLHPGNLTNFEPLEVSPKFKVVQYAVTGLLATTAGLVALLSGRPQSDAARWFELNMVLVLTLLASPLTWTHYYAFCLIPLSGYAMTERSIHGWWHPTIAVAAVLVSLPVVLALPTLPALQAVVERVLISHYVAGAIVLLGALCASRWQARQLHSAHAALGVRPPAPMDRVGDGRI